MTKKELGENYFKQGYNCAQSVVLAYVDELSIDEKTALTLISGFGGGFGRMREVCGAVSGMVAVLSAKEGYSDPTDNEAKAGRRGLLKSFPSKRRDRRYTCRIP